MATSWTPERRARQAELIRQWQPWAKSTGPRTTEGKAKASKNAYKGGHWLMLRELARLVNAEIAESKGATSQVSFLPTPGVESALMVSSVDFC